MQLLVDLFPVILFFAVYSIVGSIYWATAALMGALLIQICVQWIRHRTVSKLLLISGIAALLLGGATLILRNAIFVQWKPTIANWLFALAFLFSRFYGEKTLLERMLGEAMQLPVAVWRQLNWMWIVSCFVLGALNLYVVYNYTEAVWVQFKLVSIIVFTVVTMLLTVLWAWRHLPEETQNES